MGTDAARDQTPGQRATRGETVSGSGVWEDAQSLWRELRGLIHERFRLAALETQQAGRSLVAMTVAGIMVAVLLSSAWLGLVAAGVLGLVENGMVASSAILLAVALNFLAALILCAVIGRKSRYLRFPATTRSLQPRPERRPDMQQS